MRSTVFKMVLLVISVFLHVGIAGTSALAGHEGMVETSAGSAMASAFQISQEVISNGGTDAESDGFALCGTVAQPAVGTACSPSFRLSHGFWPEDQSGPVLDCRPGDADGSGGIDIDDVVYLIAYVFQSGPSPVPYIVASGDANCSCSVDIDDIVFLIAYVFQEGPAPCSCQEWAAGCGSP
jgi:hypothetical protein